MSYQIIIDLGQHLFTFIPGDHCLIIDDDITPDQQVIFYNLTYINKETSEETRSHIPYYMSNGHTNQLKTFMLLPFMCFDQRDGINCPISKNPLAKGGLLKYVTNYNINVNIITQQIEQIFVKFYDSDRGVGAGILMLNQLKQSSQTNTIGITSVLPRIINIIDFIIASSSDWIMEIQPNLKSYRPSVEPLNRENISDNGDYTREDFYRFQLIKELNYYIKELINNNYIQIKEVQFEPRVITRAEFNQIIGLYTNPEQNIINIQNYITISKYLHLVFKKYTEDIAQDPTKIKFVTKISQLLKYETRLFSIDSRHALQKNIEMWTGIIDPRFNKKYLKYKNKYINLKNKII